jgi:hypothetical protein
MDGGKPHTLLYSAIHRVDWHSCLVVGCNGSLPPCLTLRFAGLFARVAKIAISLYHHFLKASLTTPPFLFHMSDPASHELGHIFGTPPKSNEVFHVIFPIMFTTMIFSKGFLVGTLCIVAVKFNRVLLVAMDGPEVSF